MIKDYGIVRVEPFKEETEIVEHGLDHNEALRLTSEYNLSEKGNDEAVYYVGQGKVFVDPQ